MRLAAAIAIAAAIWAAFTVGYQRGRLTAPELIEQRARHYEEQDALLRAEIDAMGQPYLSDEATLEAIERLVLDRLHYEASAAPTAR